MKPLLDLKEVTTLLRERGFKVTPQRLAVYSALAKTTAHPNAEMIYRELKPYYPTMSLATVYKTLGIFCNVGIAQALNVGEEAFRFDANVTAHPHVRCTVCGCVDDVGELHLPGADEQIAQNTGYSISGHQYYFFGVCPICQSKAVDN